MSEGYLIITLKYNRDILESYIEHFCVPRFEKEYFSDKLFFRKNIIFVGNFLQIPHSMEENNGKYLFGVVKVGDKGQIVIPRDARKQYDIKPGDSLMLLGDQNGMALIKTEVFQTLVEQVMEGLTK